MGDGVDFVVVGFGLGAVMMLAGFALRDLGPWFFGSNVSSQSLPEFEMVKTTIRKQTLSSIGTGIATAGTGLALVTFAALMAKTEDELGTIVVGMSLALAAVGVGAWTYDAIRRYRAAMEMVTGQEQSILARLSPQAPRVSGPVNQPASTRPVDGQDEIEDRSEEVSDFGTGPDHELESELDDPEQIAGDANSPSIEGTASDSFTPAEDSVDNVPLATPVGSSASDADESSSPDESPEREHTARDSTESPGPEVPRIESPRPKLDSEPEATPSNTVSASRWPQFNRSSEKPRSEPTVEETFTALPPLPEEHNDTLIEESVRLDFRTDTDRSVPSWLFEDLDTDLAKPGNAATEDPIDQFRGSQPRQRGSALDRIMASDGPEEPVEPDEADVDPNPLPASKRRTGEES